LSSLLEEEPLEKAAAVTREFLLAAKEKVWLRQA